ncbi:MAG TPA: putative oxidoreductase C-terminal domain-containing protein [Verrucomicrobiae bacterium]|nr:putative oxidoreductase C-terminal domain-containing protein [Verrucomicrobiae bacterium]
MAILAMVCLFMTDATSALGQDSVRLLTLDPGHFHAGLVQKYMYPQVSPIVHVYSPGGPDLQEHLRLVESFNQRTNAPTHWQEEVYTGADFLKRMLRDKAGNVVVIAGNNRHKTEYIDRCVGAGLNVLADKPMAITPAGFGVLREAFAAAARKKVLLYDIMTERYEIVSTLERELARNPALFGTFQTGTAEDPAVTMESVHHFYKDVAGKPLIRPAWSFDITQQGEAIPDVGTHLVDLVQWECFPDQALNWQQDVRVLQAHRWPTQLSPAQFQRVTGLGQFPEFLKKDVGPDGELNVYENGDVTFRLRGIYVKVTALWHFQAPPGAKDTHQSRLRGTHATLAIRQGPEQNYQARLYVRNNSLDTAEQFEQTLRTAVGKLCNTWPGLDVARAGEEWQVVIPEKYNVGHEAHFAQVTEHFLRYLAQHELPAWEVPNMLTKYYVTTQAYGLSHETKGKANPK